MADFNYIIPRQVQPQPPLDVPGALLKGFAGPLALSGQITQNQLAQEKLRQFQDTRNALAQYAQTKDMAPLAQYPEVMEAVRKNQTGLWVDTFNQAKLFAGSDPTKYPLVREALTKAGVPENLLPPVEKIQTPDAMLEFLRGGDLFAAQLKRMEKGPVSVGAWGLYDPVSGKILPPTQKPTTILSPTGQPMGQTSGAVHVLPNPPQPQIQMFEDDEGKLVPVDIKSLTQGKPLEGLRKPTTSANVVTPEDTESLLEGVRTGLVDPNQLSKRGLNPVLAKAAKQGINIGQLKLDWKASERLASTMNSTQMVRFDTLSETVMGTIDRVIDLSNKMKMSGVPLYNAAKLAEVKNIEGNSPKGQLIEQYMAALTTLKEEYANFAQGGYAPTESSFKLSNDLINQNYGSKQMQATLEETKRLVNIRREAFKAVQAQKIGGPGSPKPAGVQQVVQNLPPASKYRVGTVATDQQSGIKYKSDGKNWVKQ